MYCRTRFLVALSLTALVMVAWATNQACALMAFAA